MDNLLKTFAEVVKAAEEARLLIETVSNRIHENQNTPGGISLGDLLTELSALTVKHGELNAKVQDHQTALQETEQL